MKKYTADGKKVVIIGQINNTDYIVQEIFVTDDGSEIPSGEKFVTKNLLDEPAKTWLEKRNEELKNKEKESLRYLEQISEKTRIEKIKLDSISSAVHSSLKVKDFIDSELFDTSILANFLCGNIKYLVIGGYSSWKIVDMIEKTTETEYGRFNGLKLASILGGSEGDIHYRIHQYSDHSGSSEEAYPFNTLEDAKEKLKELAIESVDKNHLSKEQFSYLMEVGVVLDEETLKKYKLYQEELKNKNIEYYKKQIEDFQEKIEIITKE